MNGDKIEISESGKEMLSEYAFVFLLNEEGDVIWGWNLPANLPKHYSLSEVAGFSRWYIEDYPVTVWVREPGVNDSRRSQQRCKYYYNFAYWR